MTNGARKGHKGNGEPVKPGRPNPELRERAEEWLERKRPPAVKGKTEAEMARLVHELEVHQLELEMQNEELRQAHADVDKLLAQYSDLYDFAPTGYLTINRDGNVQQANLEAARLLGLERSRLQGRRLRGFVAERDRRAFDAFLPRAFASHVAERREFALVREGQELLFVRIEFLVSEDGQTGRVVLFDLTEHQRAEEQARLAEIEAEKLAFSERSRRALLSAAEDQRAAAAALAESEAKANAMIKYAPTGIYELDFRGKRFLSVNDAMCRILGYTREELLAVGPLAVLDEESRARFADRVKRTLSGQPIEEAVDYRVIRKDGSVIDAVLYVTFNPEGDRALVVAHDVTERKQAERKLRETLSELKRSNEDLEQYAYVASHDLQEPLRMVANYVELLRKRYQGQLDDKADKYISYAVDGAVRMQGLIQDLLIYSRAGRWDLNIRSVNLVRVVQRAMENLTAAIGLSGARIESGPLPTVRGDESQLVQLFQNLIDNAIKFRGKELPVIRITADTETRGRGDAETSVPSVPSVPFVTISVADNGIGIDPKHGERIFRLFQRLHTHEEYPGTGIGLAVCKKIVERHGGTIRVEPAEGGGSVFRFTLPKQGKIEAEVEVQAEAKPEEPGTKNQGPKNHELRSNHATEIRPEAD